MVVSATRHSDSVESVIRSGAIGPRRVRPRLWRFIRKGSTLPKLLPTVITVRHVAMNAVLHVNMRALRLVIVIVLQLCSL